MVGGYIVTGLACAVLLSCLWKLVNWVWIKPKKLEMYLRKQGLRGSSYRLLVGDVKETYKMRSEAREKPMGFSHDYLPRILPFFHQHFNKYGENSFTWMGPIPMINITDAELIRDAFTRMDEFRKSKVNPLIKVIAPGLVSYEGEKWAKHRKLIGSAFRLEKLKLLLPSFYTSIVEVVNKWEKIVNETGSSEIDVWPYLTSLTADGISRAAFGSSYDEGSRIFELLKEQTELILIVLQSFYLPGWNYLPTKNNKRMKAISDEIRTLLKGIIDKRKKAMEAGKPAKADLLGILLESNFHETESRGTKKISYTMTEQEVIDECKLFYNGGYETTSVLLVWTMILLSKYQDWQTRAREEVVTKFGKNQPDFDGLNHLKIVTMILNEVLRLYPPVVSITRRVYDRETKLGNLAVPSGAMVNLTILHAHQDSKFWGDDAKEFNPERFSEGVVKATRGNNSFFPFGCGPRICIGQNFAMMEAKMALSMFLQHFSFELSPSYTHAPTSILNLQPQYGAHLILRRL